MTTVHQVPSDIMIRRLSDKLRTMPQISPPSWSLLVKTGSHRERPPQDKDWWYTRCASLLRKLYLHGPLGLSNLESIYGGRTRVQYAKAHHRKSGQSVIRKPLQQLEVAELVVKKSNQGRILTSKGLSLLDKLSTEIFRDIVKENDSLARYT